MTEIRKADPAARRRAVWLIIIGAIVSALFILAFERYRPALQEWLFSDPRAQAQRLNVALAIAGILFSAPVLVFALHVWRLGTRIVRSGELPPPGLRVIRDMPVVTGTAARSRGRGLQALALVLVIATALLWLLYWRLAELLQARGAPI